MRISRIKNNQGSVIVLFMLTLPLFVAMLVIVIDMGRIIVARARLVAAADQAGVAGAASLARSMNLIALENSKINRAWAELESDFKNDSQQDKETAKKRFEKYGAERDAALERIGELRDGFAARAEAAALGTLAAGAPKSAGTVFIKNDMTILDDIDRARQYGRAGYGSIEGPFIDPENYDGGSFEGLKFLIKERAPNPVMGVFASQKISPLIGGRIGVPDVEINFGAASMAFGGSIEDYALRGADASLYRAALIPMWSLGDKARGIIH